MPLTAAEVRGTSFSTTRMRAGYDMDEVDAFLDIVEADVAQYADELQRSRDGEAVLRTQCDQIQSRLTIAEQQLIVVQEAVARRESSVPAAPVLEPPADISELVAEDPEAVSILALAQATADEIIRFAEARAAGIRASVSAMLDEQKAVLDRP